MNKKFSLILLLLPGVFLLLNAIQKQEKEPIAPNPIKHDFQFKSLAKRWDEAIPLGNGMLGALIWEKDGKLRFSLDRADLWDLRPTKEFQRKEFRFSHVYELVQKGDYTPIHELIDVPYSINPGPSKIPAGALEFDISEFGEVESVRLNLEKALCTVKWGNGVILEVFIHATEPVGRYRFINLPSHTEPAIVPPPFGRFTDLSQKPDNEVSGQDLRRLGYPEPVLLEEGNTISYHQEGWEDFSFDIYTSWKQPDNNTLTGVWTITTKGSPYSGKENTEGTVGKALNRSFREDFDDHTHWWRSYWDKSFLHLPDSILEKQWYREVYKFGAASRRGAPPITLQAVWTADNGRLPPWKGDFHNDLNTQLSYWPCYSGNRLEEGQAFLEWLWEIKPHVKQFTRNYFGTNGLNVPGVCTLTGEPMGGWGQYSLSLTTAAWLAHHFYLHWKYSLDREFLAERAYPWLREVAVFLDEISIRRKDGLRKLPLSSSPEINDNRLDAWFPETTNYDLTLIRWLYGAVEECAKELGKRAEALKWHTLLLEWPDLALSEEDGRLLIAPDKPLSYSHRHFSHLMAIHPLGLIKWENGEKDRQTIKAALSELERHGSEWWVGYSYSWLGNLAARAMNGKKAAEALRIFAECFCLPNSFHVNGDQTRSGKSKYTYRPFTLEGNFAFAAGIQEMLLQSHTGVIRLFPAVPETWKDVSFHKLRAEGAILISAKMEKGKVSGVELYPEKGGIIQIANPYKVKAYSISGISEKNIEEKNGVIVIQTKGKEKIKILPNK